MVIDKCNNRCNIKSKFRVMLSIPTAKGFLAVESSNGSVLRVVWICWDADQLRTIVHDNDRTQSLLLATELFSMRRHIECGNDDLTWQSGRGRDPWEQQLSTRSGSRGTRRGGDGARIWRGVSPEESSVVVDKSSEKLSQMCFWNHYCFCHVIFFVMLIASNVCRRCEQNVFVYFLPLIRL